jgi:hypothetical protein
MVFGEINSALSVWDRLRKWWKGRNDLPVETVATRFTRLFEAHGVIRSQIPRLLGYGLQLPDVRDDAALLVALDDTHLDAACTLFGVRREWLDGASERIYESPWCYKRPEGFFAELARLETPAAIAPVRAFTTAMPLDYQAGGEQRIELVMVETVGWIGEHEIYRYRPFADGWVWSYSESRLQLKAMVAVYGKQVPLFKVSREAIDSLYAGKQFPGEVMRGTLLSTPSLEDYCMPQSRNWHARETEELPMVEEYIAGIPNGAESWVQTVARLKQRSSIAD